MAAAEAGVFSDCAVHLLPYPDVPASQRSALVAKLESHGARVLARFCKQASHVVVLRTHASSAEDQAEGDRELRALFAKISQLQELVQVVSTAWVHECLEQRRRVLERSFCIKRPQELLLQPGKTPPVGGRSTHKRRTRGAAAAAAGGTSRKVTQAAALDVNESLFSSSQQLQELQADRHTAADRAGGSGAAVDSPLHIRGSHRVVFHQEPRQPGMCQQQQQQQHGLTAKQAAAAAACRQAALQQQAAAPAGFLALGGREIGSATQMAADVLDALPESALDMAECCGQLPPDSLLLYGAAHHHAGPPAAGDGEDAIEDSDQEDGRRPAWLKPCQQQPGAGAGAGGRPAPAQALVAAAAAAAVAGGQAPGRAAAAAAAGHGLPPGRAAGDASSSSRKQQQRRPPQAISGLRPRCHSSTPPTTTGVAANSAAQHHSAPVGAAPAGSAGGPASGLSAKAALKAASRRRSSIRRGSLWSPAPAAAAASADAADEAALTPPPPVAAPPAAAASRPEAVQQQQEQQQMVQVPPPQQQQQDVGSFSFAVPCQLKVQKEEHTPAAGRHSGAAAGGDGGWPTPRLLAANASSVMPDAAAAVSAAAAVTPVAAPPRLVAAAAAAAVGGGKAASSTRKRGRQQQTPAGNGGTAAAAAAAAAEAAVTPSSSPRARRCCQGADDTVAAAAAAAAAAGTTPNAGGSCGRQRRIPARLAPWPCAACTYENSGAAKSCALCSTLKPPAAAGEHAGCGGVRATTPPASACRRNRQQQQQQQQQQQPAMTDAAGAAGLSGASGTPGAAAAAAAAAAQPLALALFPRTRKQQQAAPERAATPAAGGGTNDAVPESQPLPDADAADEPMAEWEQQQQQQEEQQQRTPAAGSGLETGVQGGRQAAAVAAAGTAKRSSSRGSSRSSTGAAAAAAAVGTPPLDCLPNVSRLRRPKLSAAAVARVQQHGSAPAALPAAKGPLTSSTRQNQPPAAAAKTPGRKRPSPGSDPRAPAQPSAAGAEPAAGASGRQAPGACYVACTSVSSAVAELARSAAQRLPGCFRACVDGHEEGRLTHLVVGAERRTLKLLLGVANGAWLLTPEWLTSSLDQGAWQPPERFAAAVRFADVAASVRAARAAGCYSGPLAGRLVLVQCVSTAGGPLGSRAAASAHRVSLQRLVRALGGRVCGARVAEVAVIAGGAGVPRELPAGAVALREEWLLRLAESHSAADAADTRAFEVPRR